MIKVLALYADQTGCGDYRVRFPADAVNRNADLNVSVSVADHLDVDAVYESPRMRIRSVNLPPGTQVVSFQRPSRAALVGAMRWLKERRPDVGLVVELDDDLMHLPAGHEAFHALDPRISPSENTSWLRMALNMADAITVSTPELGRRYGGNRSTFVVRNGVPPSMTSQCPSRALTTGVKERERTIGWAGYTGTHPGDLDITNGALVDVMDRKPQGRTIRFRNIGPIENITKALGVGEDQASLVSASGWLEPSMYRVALSALDIGIVPLQDTAFNRGKSALKALEFAAAGVPVVASDLPEFQLLQKAGLPLWLVKPKRKEWVSALTRMAALSDEELRQLAFSHRRWVTNHATVDNYAADWAHSWTYAASVAQRRTNGARAAAAAAS